MTNVNTTPPVENQMKLFEDVVPVWLNGTEIVEYKLADLPPDDQIIGPAPSPQMIESVKQMGIIVPIIISKVMNGRKSKHKLSDGGRRIKAARAAGLTTIPARMCNLNEMGTAALGLMINAQRSVNQVQDYYRIKALSAEGYSDRMIEAFTGMNNATIASTMLMDKLKSEIIEGYAQGRVAKGAINELIMLPVEQQDDAIAELRATGRLTAKTVHAMRQVNVASAVSTLPDDIFGSGTPVAYRDVKGEYDEAMRYLDGKNVSAMQVGGRVLTLTERIKLIVEGTL